MLIELSIFFFCCGCFDFTSTYNHNKIKGIPNTKNMLIVRTGIRKTNRNIPKHNVAIPRAKSQRLVRLSIYTNEHLSDIRHFFFLFLLFCPSSFSVTATILALSSSDTLFRFLRNFLTSSSISLNCSSDIFAILESHSIPYSSYSLEKKPFLSVNEMFQIIIFIWFHVKKS